MINIVNKSLSLILFFMKTLQFIFLLQTLNVLQFESFVKIIFINGYILCEIYHYI